MSVDNIGQSAMGFILCFLGLFVLDAVVEIAILLLDPKYSAENVYNKNNVQIPNSAMFNNQIAQIVYSQYLYDNVKKEDGDKFFNGSVYDIVGEWRAHNLATYLTGLTMFLSILPLSFLSDNNALKLKLYSLHNSSVHADIGASINDENRKIVREISKFYKYIFQVLSFNFFER